ncbi:hypothetical protein AGMMS49545_18070 [Betaproteobacteria bacterium]|nr:hypothetical protein AGMMS49545_18070 [Betaproteobacteria bacterium]GHU44654.1 hypothetical protein AGMMS50289_13460 [Betaproteobacteria bacterium]
MTNPVEAGFKPVRPGASASPSAGWFRTENLNPPAGTLALPGLEPTPAGFFINLYLFISEAFGSRPAKALSHGQSHRLTIPD